MTTYSEATKQADQAVHMDRVAAARAVHVLGNAIDAYRDKEDAQALLDALDALIPDIREKLRRIA